MDQTCKHPATTPHGAVAAEIRREARRRQRMTVEELGAEARQVQIGSLSEIRFAVLETSGRISFVTD